jgi:hypothetical protein
MLIVKVIRINKPIEKKDWMSKNDLRIEIEYMEKIYTTTTKWNTENPQWNEIFVFDTNPIQNNILKVRLYEEDSWSKSDIINEESVKINMSTTNYVASNVILECNIIKTNLEKFLLIKEDCDFYKENLSIEVEKNTLLNNNIIELNDYNNELNEHNKELKTQYDYLNAVITNFTNEVSKINKNNK